MIGARAEGAVVQRAQEWETDVLRVMARASTDLRIEHLGQRFQNDGVNSTSNVKISSRPSNIASTSSHFTTSGSVW